MYLLIVLHTANIAYWFVHWASVMTTVTPACSGSELPNHEVAMELPRRSTAIGVRTTTSAAIAEDQLQAIKSLRS